MNNVEIKGKIPTLETERLVLRATRFGDEVEIFKHCNQFLPGEIPNIPYPYTMEDAVKYVAKVTMENLDFSNNEWRWRICSKATGEFIGDCGFTLFHEDKAAKLSSNLNKASQNQGLEAEAMAKIIDFGFNHHPGLLMFTSASVGKNPKPSIAAQTLGFVLDRTHKSRVLLDNTILDSTIYYIDRNKWNMSKFHRSTQPSN